ncbi:NAD(P)-binding protein [Lentzea sp. NPDC034063]|uniref:NAD(P)-binding protein n=1 Tax=unclassified Lentzea TaxID=2643253 RepID=UPI0033F4BDAF
MGSKTVLIGYSVRGRVLVTALRESGCTHSCTVVDADPVRAEQAVMDGLRAVVGPAWRLRTLWLAGVHDADHVVVAVTNDDLALRVTSAVRSVNEFATVITVVSNPELHEVTTRTGADHVVAVRQVSEWVPGGRHRRQESGDPEWSVVERAVEQREIGLSPRTCGHQVLAVLRRGQRLWAEDPAVARLVENDRLLVLRDV